MNSFTIDEHGFISLYVVVIVGIMMIVAGVTLNTALQQTSLARDDGESLKAFYAAEAGIECVRFYRYSQDTDAFDFDTSGIETYPCGVGEITHDHGGSDECNPRGESTFILNDFDNGAEVEISLKIEEITSFYGSECLLPQVVANGKNTSETSGGVVVERSRWEKM